MQREDAERIRKIIDERDRGEKQEKRVTIQFVRV
jgi:hypothetical protein